MSMTPMQRTLVALGSACETSARAARRDEPTVGVTAAHAPTPPPAGVPDALRGIVEAHNTRRAAHCAPPLVWSPKNSASRWPRKRSRSAGWSNSASTRPLVPRGGTPNR